jgi:toxin ParE1/3/4
VAEVRIAPAARGDLRDIRIYGKAGFGSAVTGLYLSGLRDAFSRIAARPRSGRPEADLGPGVRSLAYRSHRIYYRSEGEDVFVIRILHHARDVQPRLFQ